MTPDEVVARARELGGQEALLTVRGMVTANDEGWVHVSTNSGALVILPALLVRLTRRSWTFSLRPRGSSPGSCTRTTGTASTLARQPVN